MDSTLARDVSRSFSITLKLLPGPMRGPVSLAYLLARASDTLADTDEVPSAERIERLAGFVAEIDGAGSSWRADLGGFVELQKHQGERRLMERLGECFAQLDALPGPQQEIVRKVIRIITRGQQLDLERFGAGPAILADENELLDYCWRVAGCVGAFWTEIGFETMGTGFSRADPQVLEEMGVRYGQGLQLVNILRDLPKDLETGRCYLPHRNPDDVESLMAMAAEWRGRARGFLEVGESYAKALPLRRLRAATVLPALIGTRTLDLLDRADWEELEGGVKVSRGTVRWCVLRAFAG